MQYSAMQCNGMHGKKMEAVHFTTMPCEPDTANQAQEKPAIYFQYLSLNHRPGHGGLL